MNADKRLFADLVYSADDGGWYADLYRPDGSEVGPTEVTESKRQARQAAAAVAHSLKRPLVFVNVDYPERAHAE